jgi:hypothetical protein
VSEIRPEHIERVVQAVVRDLTTTLKWSDEVARAFVLSKGSVDDYAEAVWDAVTLADRVIGNVQEAVQRDLIDTTWPICLHHRTHPLTIDENLAWRCPYEDTHSPDGYMDRVPLGWLDAIWPSE